MPKSVLTAIRVFARGALDLVTGERATQRSLSFLSAVEQRARATGEPVPGPAISPAVQREFFSSVTRPLPPPMPLDDLTSTARSHRVSLLDLLSQGAAPGARDDPHANSKPPVEGERLDLPILSPVLLAMSQGKVKTPSADEGGLSSAAARVAGGAAQRADAEAPGDGSSAPAPSSSKSAGASILGFLGSGRRGESDHAGSNSAGVGASTAASGVPPNHELADAVRKVNKTHREFKTALQRMKTHQSMATGTAAGTSLMSVAPGSALLGGGEASLMSNVLGHGVTFAAAASPLGAPIVYVTPTELHPTAILDGGIPMADHGSHHGGWNVLGSGVGMGSGADILGGGGGANASSILGSSASSFDGVGGVDRGIL